MIWKYNSKPIAQENI